jgi:IMP dehydrogenase
MFEDLREALTFDDVLLVPGYSEVIPRDVDVTTRLTPAIPLRIPLVSSAMDTVTEASTAIRMAREGGIGFIHKNLSIEDQAREVNRVKKAQSGIVVDPVTVAPSRTLEDALALMRHYRISGLPVVDAEKRPVGILTNRDVRFEKRLTLQVGEVMTKTVTMKDGSRSTRPRTSAEAPDRSCSLSRRLRPAQRVIDPRHRQARRTRRPAPTSSAGCGRRAIGSARSPGPHRGAARVGCDVSASTPRGHSAGMLGRCASPKKFPGCSCRGNVATRGRRDADRVRRQRVSRRQAGNLPADRRQRRRPQLTAIGMPSRPRGVAIIADGGIKYSGDVAKALAAGADTVMIGSLFAGTDEAPGEIILYQGRSYKAYRGMGSIGAMKDGSRDRYFQGDVEVPQKLVPEGIEGRVPYKGPLRESLYQLVGGLRASMGYLGCATIAELHAKARFVKISAAGLRESHVHDVIITKEAPNYRVE